MIWTNSVLVTNELFLSNEFVLQGKTKPSLQTILDLNEIIELVVLKEKLLMPTVDHITILKTLNYQEILKLGGNEAINWKYEIKNLGSANLAKPILTNCLYDAGILILDTEQSEDREFREFGEDLYSKHRHKDWYSRAVGLRLGGVVQDIIELDYIRYFNNFLKSSSDPIYLKKLILATPDLLVSHPDLKRSKYDASWMFRFYKQVQPYAEFARLKGLSFSDTSLMQLFIAFNFQHSDTFIDIFYNRLKQVREEQIQEFLELQQPWLYCLPPLTSILLQRCKTLDDLPTQLLNLRSEFTGIRQSLTEYHKKYEEANTIKEKLEIKQDFQNSVDLFMRKIKGGKTRIIKTMIDFAVGQSDSIIQQDLSGPLKAVLGKLADYIYQRKLYPWVNSFLQLYEKSLDIQLDRDLYQKIFGEIDFDHYDEFQEFSQNSIRLLSIHSESSLTKTN
jgi:hypothetical protein